MRKEEHQMKNSALSSTGSDVKKVYGEADAGCWIDGARGIYIGVRIMGIALAHGWAPSDVEPGEEFTSPDGEWYHEFADEAEQFMDRFAAHGFWFGYNEHSGDWGLWESEED